MQLKIDTLNLCLGLPNKKDLIKELITCEKIDILCMQETEVNKNIDTFVLSFNGYEIELEKNPEWACTLEPGSTTQGEGTLRGQIQTWWL